MVDEGVVKMGAREVMEVVGVVVCGVSSVEDKAAVVVGAVEG